MDTVKIPDSVDRLREHFNTGQTKPIPWRLSQLKALQKLLEDNGPQLAEALAADLGKAEAEAYLTEIDFTRADVKHIRKNLRSWTRPQRVHTPSHLLPGRSFTLLEPLGVTTIIGPFNYPVQLLLSPLAGALAAGNTVIVKPSEHATATAELLETLLLEYLDNDAIAVVQGGVPEVTELLAQRVDHIFFTGSTRVGKIVAKAAAENLTKVTLELGGKSPAIVEPGIDLSAVATRIAWGKFTNAGQTCIAPDYVLAVGDTAETLKEELAVAINAMYGTSPADSPDYGRIINDETFDRLTGYLDNGRAVVGGTHNREKRYIAPTVLDRVDLDSPVMQEEIFGPILPIIPVNTLEEAIGFVRQGEKPLSLYPFCASDSSKRKVLTRTSSGAVGFNIPLVHCDIPGLPFGGVGLSGQGAYHGKHSVENFSHRKPVFDKPLMPDTMRVIYAPWSEWKQKIMRKLR
ncbi:aldehyde dehydrogenase family protein [Haloglycomyces albus]|uniref:aldehyde dehydrogenase family protein n=1 Tax=Haloglycomyces albus TaxID=526067 RepID=UPI0004A23C84|nr:aldehyde dehydrogenase family protein [Haloglycomyces albus]